MKRIEYKFLSAEINRGTKEEPKIEKVILNKSMTWSEANEEIAKREAYKGEYTIEDDGKPEPVLPADEGVSWDDMAKAIKEGVNEV